MARHTKRLTLESVGRKLAKELDVESKRISTILMKLVADNSMLLDVGADLAEKWAVELASLVRGAFEVLGDVEAFELLEDSGGQSLVDRIWFAEHFVNADRKDELPLYSLRELSRKVEKFVDYLTREEEALLRKGLPSRRFSECRWLASQLGRLYVVKRFDPHPGPGGYKWVRFISSQIPRPRTTEIPHWGELRACSYESADSLTGLQPTDARRLSGLRESIHRTKLGVLREATSYIRNSDRDSDFLRRGLDIVQGEFDARDVEFLFDVDRRFTQVPDEWGCLSPMFWSPAYHGPIQPGGLTNIVNFIGHVECECKLGQMCQLRELLQPVVAEGKADRRLNLPDQAWVYFHCVRDGQRGVLDQAVETFSEMEAAVQDFWREFENRVQGAVKRLDARVTVETRLPIQMADQLHQFLQQMAAFGKVTLEAGGSLPRIETTVRASGANVSSPMARFPSPENLRWEEVTVSFVSNESIRVSARKKGETYTFAELGFKDRRKGDRPNSRWGTLQRMAVEGGEISWKTNQTKKESCQMRTAMKDIRRRLQGLMGIAEDPFHTYRKKKAYVSRFTLRDARPVERQADSAETDDE